MIVHGPHNTKRYRVLYIAMLTMGAFLLMGCGQEESYTPPPATIIRATEEVSPTVAMREEAEPSPTATSPSMPPTRPPAPTAPPSPTDSYPYPPPVRTPRHTATPVVYPTK
jgi:hypothetical protein